MTTNPPAPPTERKQLDALIPALSFILTHATDGIGITTPHRQLLQRLRDIEARARLAMRAAGIDVE